jgi:hypothetical protein
VVGWGENAAGQVIEVIGTPHLGSTTGVVTIASQVLSNAIAITVGDEHSLALKNDVR